MKAEEVLTPDEAAKLLKVTAKTIGNMCRDGRLHAVKVGREWRVPMAAIDALFAVAGSELPADRPETAEPIDPVEPSPASGPREARGRRRAEPTRPAVVPDILPLLKGAAPTRDLPRGAAKMRH